MNGELDMKGERDMNGEIGMSGERDMSGERGWSVGSTALGFYTTPRKYLQLIIINQRLNIDASIIVMQ